MKAFLSMFLQAIFIVLFTGSALILFSHFLESRHSSAQYENFKTEYGFKTDLEASFSSADHARPSLFPREARKNYPALAAWLRIPGTSIDYPVMHTPEEPDYYLRRGLDGKKDRHGVPYLDGASMPGCRDVPLVIYGHRMRDGTMFADLVLYEQPEFLYQNPVIWLDTYEEEGEYEIFAVLYLMEGSEAAGVLYENTIREEEFCKKMNVLEEKALYQTGISPEFGDQLLFLVTCGASREEERLVVAARRKNNE